MAVSDDEQVRDDGGSVACGTSAANHSAHASVPGAPAAAVAAVNCASCLAVSRAERPRVVVTVADGAAAVSSQEVGEPLQRRGQLSNRRRGDTPRTMPLSPAAAHLRRGYPLRNEQR